MESCRVKCLVCYKYFKWTATNEGENGHYTNKVLSLIFDTLFKSLGVVISEKDWDFSVDPFPFCKNCRNQVAKLCQLTQDLDRINKKINKVVANITCVVVESTESRGNNSLYHDRPSSSKRIQNIQVEEKISNYRHRIQKRFSPHVPLNRETTEAALNAQTSRERPNNSSVFNLMEYFDDGDDFINPEVNLHESYAPYAAEKVQVESTTSMMSSSANFVDNSIHQPFLIEVTTSETMMKRDMLQRTMRSMTKLPNGNLAYGGFEVQTYPDGGAKCLTCGLEFTKKSKRKYMMEHLRIVHVKESGKFQCHICGKQFNTKPHLKQHERTHLEVRAFACTICSHTYKTAVERNRHMKRHYVNHNNNPS